MFGPKAERVSPMRPQVVPNSPRLLMPILSRSQPAKIPGMTKKNDYSKCNFTMQPDNGAPCRPVSQKLCKTKERLR